MLNTSPCFNVFIVLMLHAAGEDEDYTPMCWVFLPKQEAAGQAGKTEGGGEPEWRDRAADQCKHPAVSFNLSFIFIISFYLSLSPCHDLPVLVICCGIKQVEFRWQSPVDSSPITWVWASNKGPFLVLSFFTSCMGKMHLKHVTSIFILYDCFSCNWPLLMRPLQTYSLILIKFYSNYRSKAIQDYPRYLSYKNHLW